MPNVPRHKKVGGKRQAVVKSAWVVRERTVIILGIFVAALIGIVYFFSNPNHHSPFDYTLQVASAFLQGELGMIQKPNSWLNEFIFLNNHYYSAFPLGAVLSMFPLAILKAYGIIQYFPSAFITAFIALGCSLLSFGVMYHFTRNLVTTVFATIALLCGTWFWTNLAFGSAWQLALGFAVFGQLGAIYFVLVRPQSLIAGFFFAMAFGNRTELILTAPVFMYLLIRNEDGSRVDFSGENIRKLAEFCLIPFLLGVATLSYNFARFGSPLDFGYARIPGVLEEPWYKDGIFSFSMVGQNAVEMFIRKWRIYDTFPYVIPTGFGGSIFLSSPFLLLLIFVCRKFLDITIVSWVAILLVIIPVYMHGNAGGWQFSFRYAVVLLPWLWLLWATAKRESISRLMAFLIIVSIGINAYATWLFHWTSYVQP